eukprot:TRINITY_DN4833_c0_g1_i4.p1 TRINITY_DN4833_c0_g1~~TRINITY_DN4833_c0_g1_i4.p1  ORF type:complete len:121 (-),score=12.75 TRINITY_DN4833_c0_g1_i4:69-431(-)
MSSSLGALLKPSGHTSLEELKSAAGLYLQNERLASVPESIGQLTHITALALSDNLLSSLPECVGQMTNLAVLFIHNNPITELPESITRLKNLSFFQIEYYGKMTIQRAPIGITVLPCDTK